VKKNSELIKAINASPKIVRDFIHEMESWDYSSQCYELFHLKETVAALKWKISRLQEELKAYKEFDK